MAGQFVEIWKHLQEEVQRQDEKMNEKERFDGKVDEKWMVVVVIRGSVIVGACSPKETVKPVGR